MKKLFFKLLIISLPVFLVFFVFMFFDPFKIIHSYTNYNSSNSSNSPMVNRDHISTEIFIQNYPKYKFNSFKLGSSRTMAYRLINWKKHLSQDAKVYSFDAFGESIYGIYTKIIFLDKKNVDLKNVLLIFCQDITFQYDHDHLGHLYMKDPKIANTSYFNFLYQHFKSFIDLKFLFYYLKSKSIGGDLPSDFRGTNGVKYNLINNDYINFLNDMEIKQDPDKYFKKVKNQFFDRSKTNRYSKSKINRNQVAMLKKIKNIFDKHHTNFKIIISPLYSQIPFNKKDLNILRSIFPEHVYDFSGKNKITDDYRNYYERSHYLPKIGDSLMKLVYTN